MLWSVKRQGPTIYARPWSAKIFFIRASLRFSRMEQKTQAQCAKRVLFRFQGSSLFAVCICGIKQITQPPCAKRENSLWRIFECRMHPSMGAAQRKKKRKKKQTLANMTTCKRSSVERRPAQSAKRKRFFFIALPSLISSGRKHEARGAKRAFFFPCFPCEPWALAQGA